jgi:tetratricopeptide (TPR) repeat protein
MRMEKYDEAKKQYATVIAINESLADPQHDLGVIALKEGDTEEAIARLRKAVELDPTYANAWLSLGNAYAEAAKYRESADAFTSCLEANPDSIECRNNLAIVNRKAKLLDPSLKEVQTRATAENTAPSLYQLAVQFRDQGLRSEEERAYQKCLRLDGKYAPCHFGLYTIFAEDQNQKKATIACKNFLKFGSAEDFPTESETCEKFLSANAP